MFKQDIAPHITKALRRRRQRSSDFGFGRASLAQTRGKATTHPSPSSRQFQDIFRFDNALLQDLETTSFQVFSGTSAS